MITPPEKILIRIYGDSISLPRISDGIHYFETYPELLREILQSRGYDVRLYNRSAGGATLGHLYSIFSSDQGYFGNSDQTTLVIQGGVVDCAPRAIPTNVKRLIDRLPGSLRHGLIARIRSLRPWLLEHRIASAHTSEMDFRRHLQLWKNAVEPTHSRVIYLNIPPTTHAGEARLPGFGNKINQYNEITREIFSQSECSIEIVDVHEMLSGKTTVDFINRIDGHHLTHHGHRRYAEILAGFFPGNVAV